MRLLEHVGSLFFSLIDVDPNGYKFLVRQMAMQPELFHESIEDALREVIQVSGGPKVVACQLWPDKAPDAAHRTLLACLNEDRQERFSPGQLAQLLRIGRSKGCHTAMNFLASDCGYSHPQPIEPEDERARLQREYIEAVNRLSKLQAEINRGPALTRVA